MKITTKERNDEIARLRAINAELVEVLTVLCQLCADRDARFIDSLVPAHAAIFTDILRAAGEAIAKAKDEAKNAVATNGN